MSSTVTVYYNLFCLISNNLYSPRFGPRYRTYSGTYTTSVILLIYIIMFLR